ncbi:hypothetical protein B0H14DRAFT_3555533 [Mycena olivaceomarginata]|nr:hypothetical protein B0H14DRAFT_3555533 [Mycena olivaceomarginata]
MHGAVALAALHDSAESFPQPKCHPETRMEMLADLREWSLETGASKRILWLYGPAGAGKSAIMQTLARELHEAGHLGGCFFFKRGHPTRGNGRSLFTTIAYQLALAVPWLKTPISQIVEQDPSIVARSMDIQLQKLICAPWGNIHGSETPLTIIIDGLDECEGLQVHEEMLRSLMDASSQSLPLRFIVASRPEPHIRELFESPSYRTSCRLLNVEQSFDDVRKYLCDEFARIHRDHRCMANVLYPWPSANTLETLVEKSSGHFIYASTVIKFVEDKNDRPTRRLAAIESGQRSGSAFEALDQLYMGILSAAQSHSQLLPILCAITNFHLHPDSLDLLLELEHGDTVLFLRGLHSVLDVPADSDPDNYDGVSAHHASFLDFLNDPMRSRNFYVGGPDNHMNLARSILKFMAGEYHRDWTRTYLQSVESDFDLKWWEVDLRYANVNTSIPNFNMHP